MPPEAFGGGAAESAIHPGAGVLLVLSVLLTLILPRRLVVWPVLLGIFLIPLGNVLVIGGVHLMPVRVISLVSCIRAVIILATEQNSQREWLVIDSVFTCWALARSTAVMLLWLSQAAFINEMGHLWSIFGVYITLRCFIVNRDDVATAIKALAVVACVNGAEMFYERFANQNLFGTLLGGVPTVPSVRNDTIRSQGSFQHSILAGSFGATLPPLLGWLWLQGRARVLTVMAFCAAAVQIGTSGSSTPVLACTGTVIGISLWPLREHMRQVRRAFSSLLIFLHMIMKAPVWFLIARVDVTGSSTAYFRATLIDECVKHFSDWWLMGVKETESWGDHMWDLSNQFVAEGFTGGLLTIILFIALISRMYGRIGNNLKAVRGDKKEVMSFWLMGIAIFCHIMVYFGVSYWDQMWNAWACLIAIICALTPKLMQTETVETIVNSKVRRNSEPLTPVEAAHELWSARSNQPAERWNLS